ncbi:hypothetical protein HPB48_022024 [Haemaphysalis longicornis]|uniref:Uncharacterized protein n=1 Tax=Haemaphysalis longicornis TaxID=44386 RepID=A0A9J6FQN8_HAELO|nr:hypothetical protein HPB48_022024 [Haemaphysalis longicornis]
MNLHRLSESIHETEGLSLDVLFTIKTYKPDQPMGVIVSGRGTWQVVVSAFLKRELHKLHVHDPLELRNSDAIVDDLQSGVLDGCKALSVDVENLQYSLPQQDLLRCVKAPIVKDNDEQKFQAESGVTVGGFMELLTMYLRSTIIMFEGQVLLQRAGVCIGSSVAPVAVAVFSLGEWMLALKNAFRMMHAVYTYMWMIIWFLCAR